MTTAPPDLVLAGVRTADGRTVDLHLAGGRIAAVAGHDDQGPEGSGPSGTAASGAEVRSLDGWLVLPAAVEPHAHLDKTLTADLVPNPTGDLAGAVEAWHRHSDHFDHDDTRDRAIEGIGRAVAAGVTTIRSHVDLRDPLGLGPLRALVEARDATRHLCDVELSALLLHPVTGSEGAHGRSLLAAALDAGLDVVGGAPNRHPDPAANIRDTLAVARDAEAPVDLHTDETLDPSELAVASLPAAVTAAGWGGRTTASHCVSLGVQPEPVQRRLAVELAEAGVGVVTLPLTNLYLQARGRRVAPPRGLTAVEALREAGVALAAGGDNVQDPFNLLGRSDPFETAALLVAVAHLSPAEAWAAVSSGGRAVLGRPALEIGAGHPADLLVVRAGSLGEAVASAPADRIVVRAGRVVSEVRTEAVVDWRTTLR